MQKQIAILMILLMIFLMARPTAASELDADSLRDSLRSEAVVLMDADSGQVLFEKNMHQIMYPASITKVATARLALQRASLDDVITMSEEAVFSVGRDTSHIALDTDEQITMEQALYAMAIASANDAANGIAEQISGSVAAFADEMNQAAREAGAINTHFTNPHGLPDDDHVTTAFDMAKITAAALKTPGFIEIFGSGYYEIPPTNKQPETRMLSSRNKLVNGQEACEGILFSKTGWTSQAEGTLVTAACREDITLIAVVLKSTMADEKWQDTLALLDYGFDRFTRAIMPKGELAQNDFPVSPVSGDTVYIDFVAAEDATFLLPGDKTMTDVSIVCGSPKINQADRQVHLTARITLKGADDKDEAGILANVLLTGQLPETQPTTDPQSQVQGGTDKPGSDISWLIIIPVLILAAAIGLIARDITKNNHRRRRSRML